MAHRWAWLSPELGAEQGVKPCRLAYETYPASSLTAITTEGLLRLVWKTVNRLFFQFPGLAIFCKPWRMRSIPLTGPLPLAGVRVPPAVGSLPLYFSNSAFNSAS